ncbi:MAG: hypothetical protein CL583_11810 [Alteromonadaceae bacterium]|nr:hypothetical protein [Alteromonadaceae bacterium]
MQTNHRVMLVLSASDHSVTWEAVEAELHSQGLLTCRGGLETFDGKASESDLDRDTAVVVLGPGIRFPISQARRVRAVMPQAHLMFAPAPPAFSELKYQLSRAPMIGSNWSLVVPETDDLAAEISAAVTANLHRARLRSTLHRANLSIGTRALDPSDYRQLLISDHYLRNVLDQAHDAIISLDPRLKILYWSGGAERLFGLDPKTALNQPVASLPFWTTTLAEYLEQVRHTHQAITADLDVRTPDGNAQVETVISGVRDGSGSLVGFSFFMRDVTDRNEALRAEREARQRIETLVVEKEQQRRLFDSMLTSAADQSYVMDLEGRLLYGNRALAERTEMPLSEMLGKTAYELGHRSGEARQIQTHFAEVVRTRREVRAEISYTSPSGKHWALEYSLVPVMNTKGELEAVAGTTRDITERKQASEQVWREANYDALTGLPNRRLFKDRLEVEVNHSRRTGKPIALFFVDLDHFKQVNDLHGHSAGDQLLKQAAERIRACVRESDTVARLGGDEFTLLLTELDDKAHVENTAQTILDELARPFDVLGSVCHISGSVGITLCPLDASDPGELIRNADQAMYIAKNNGRSQFSFFTRSLQEEALNRLQLSADLRNAVSGGQLRLYFQPIANLGDGLIHKAEALLRWQHPTLGLLQPDEFIGLAEESGQIRKLGNWAFAQAAQWSRKWSRHLGRTVQISINKSAIQFESNGRSMNWKAYLDRLELPHESIIVEITESVLLNASSKTADKLLELRNAGLELAIDDFGTGYSSMAYLKKYEVDYLKIDQSFISDADNEASSRTIAESMILMAHKLGLKVVAEGVETKAQRDWLRSVGCDFAQGFYYSAPLPAKEFEELLYGTRRQPSLA